MRKIFLVAMMLLGLFAIVYNSEHTKEGSETTPKEEEYIKLTSEMAMDLPLSVNITVTIGWLRKAFPKYLNGNMQRKMLQR